MRCQMIGRCPIFTIGFGTVSEYSRRRVPRPPQKSTTFMVGIAPLTSGDLDDDLPAVERFRVFVGGFRLHATESEQRLERIRREPVLVALGLEAIHDETDLLLADRPVEMHVEVWNAEIAVIFQNLVLEDQVIPVGVPGQVRDESMILMQIVTRVSEDDVRRALGLQLLEERLDAFADVRKEARLEVPDDHVALRRIGEEALRAGQGLLVALAARADHHPLDFGMDVLRQEPQDRSAATDLDVVAVGADAEQTQGAGPP